MGLNKRCRVAVKRVLRKEDVVNVDGIKVEFERGVILVDGQAVTGGFADIARDVRSAVHNKRIETLPSN